jgi:hypothetical protein
LEAITRIWVHSHGSAIPQEDAALEKEHQTERAGGPDVFDVFLAPDTEVVAESLYLDNMNILSRQRHGLFPSSQHDGRSDLSPGTTTGFSKAACRLNSCRRRKPLCFRYGDEGGVPFLGVGGVAILEQTLLT